MESGASHLGVRLGVWVPLTCGVSYTTVGLSTTGWNDWTSLTSSQGMWMVHVQNQLPGRPKRVRVLVPIAGEWPQDIAHVPCAGCWGSKNLYVPQSGCACSVHVYSLANLKLDSGQARLRYGRGYQVIGGSVLALGWVCERCMSAVGTELDQPTKWGPVSD